MSSGISRRRESAKADGGNAYKEKRAEVVTAATRIFREKGFSSTTFNDIAAAVGSDRASLYYYFASKRELFEEVVRDAVTENVLRAEAIYHREGGADEKVRALVESLMESYAEHFPILYVYIQEDMNQMSGKSSWMREMRELDRRYDKAVVDIVQQGITEGTFREGGSPQVVANGIIGMLNWTHRWFQPDKFPDHGAIAEVFSEMLLGGLRVDR